MYYVINKSDSRIIWVNPADNIKTELDVYYKFDSSLHKIVKSSLHKNVGMSFEFPLIKTNSFYYTEREFEPINVYNKSTGSVRSIRSYSDLINLEEETTFQPIQNYPLDFQKFVEGSGWDYDVDKIIYWTKAVIKKLLRDKLNSGKSTPYGTFQCREEDLSRMGWAISSVSVGGVWGGQWRDINNNWVSLTFDEFKEVAVVCGFEYENLFKKSRLLIDSLQLLPKENLANFDVNIEWNKL